VLTETCIEHSTRQETTIELCMHKPSQRKRQHYGGIEWRKTNKWTYTRKNQREGEEKYTLYISCRYLYSLKRFSAARQIFANFQWLASYWLKSAMTKRQMSVTLIIRDVIELLQQMQQPLVVKYKNVTFRHDHHLNRKHARVTKNTWLVIRSLKDIIQTAQLST